VNSPYEKTRQRHLEKKLERKPLMDSGFTGKEYELEEKEPHPQGCLYGM
jgi:hypothetical protein